MRKPDKSVLRDELLTKQATVESSALHVLDGGALLHRVRWNNSNSSSCSFQDLCLQYTDHVQKFHGQSKIVFDGYDDGPSTKDHEHHRRSLNKKGTAEVIFEESTKVRMKQENFLSNSKNKSRFIDMLCTYLCLCGHDVVKCKEDADTEFVKRAIEVAKDGKFANVVADDTGVAILLLYHWNNDMADITFASEKSKKTWSIGSSSESLTPGLKPYVLAIHAWTGCDTTSAIYSKGKTSLLKNVSSSLELQRLMTTIRDCWADKEEIGQAGFKLFISMYGGKKKDIYIN